jgi:hypothetical protein
MRRRKSRRLRQGVLRCRAGCSGGYRDVGCSSKRAKKHVQQQIIYSSPLKRHSPDSKAPFLNVPTNLPKVQLMSAACARARSNLLWRGGCKELTSTRSFRSSTCPGRSCSRLPTLLYICNEKQDQNSRPCKLHYTVKRARSRVAVGKLERALAVPDAAGVRAFIRASVGITATRGALENASDSWRG